tara:strand:- start:237 stop:518 length:282 start_codon:yes stop_codon:yes gene_type:complete
LILVNISEEEDVDEYSDFDSTEPEAGFHHPPPPVEAVSSAAILAEVVVEDELNAKTAAISAVRRIERMYPEPHAWKKPTRSPRCTRPNASGVN